MGNLNDLVRRDIERILNKKGVTGIIDPDRVMAKALTRFMKMFPLVISEALMDALADAVKEELKSSGKLRPCAYWRMRPSPECRLKMQMCQISCQEYRPVGLLKLTYLRLKYWLRGR